MEVTLHPRETADMQLRLFRATQSSKCEGRTARGERFAVVTLELEPTVHETGVVFRDDSQAVDQSGNKYDTDLLPVFCKGVAQGIVSVLEHYTRLGIAIGGLKVTLRRMTIHPSDSTELAFRLAASNAMAAGLLNVVLSQEGLSSTQGR